MSHVDADLVRPAGFQFCGDSGKTTEPFLHLPMSHRRLGVSISDRHAKAIVGIASDGRIDRSPVLLDIVEDHRLIHAGDAVNRQLFC